MVVENRVWSVVNDGIESGIIDGINGMVESVDRAVVDDRFENGDNTAVESGIDGFYKTDRIVTRSNTIARIL